MKNRIYKVLSTILSVAILFSVCSVVIGAETATGNNYYVMSGGTGNGTSPASPVATVADAVAKINSDGLTIGDTANVYIMQNENWADAKNIEFGNTTEHKMTAWSADGTMTAHTATIVIKKYNGTGTTLDNGNVYLAFTPNLGENVDMNLGGPTVFEDITLVAMRNSGDKQVLVNGYNATFGENTQYRQVNCSQFNSSNTWTEIQNANIQVGVTKWDLVDYNSEFTTTVNGSVSSINLISNTFARSTFNADYNLIVNTPGNGVTVSLGSGNGSGWAYFNKNLNIDVQDASKIVYRELSGFEARGAVQVIYRNAATERGELGITATNGIYEIVDTKNLLSFTDTTGVFNVSGGENVVATNQNGLEVEVIDGVLTLPSAGKWIVAVPKSKDYYVMSGGTGDGTSPASPVATVADAVAKINSDGLTIGDTANVYIMQNENWADAKNIEFGNTTEHKMTAWSADGTMTAHTATIVIKKYNGTGTTLDNGNVYLAFTPNLGENVDMNLGGPTVFEDITLVAMRNSGDKQVLVNGYNATFGENTQYRQVNCSQFNSSNTWTEIQNANIQVGVTKWDLVDYNSEFTTTVNGSVSSINLISNTFARSTFNADYNLIVNTPGNGVTVSLGSGNGSGWAYFNKNLNIDVQDASKIVYRELSGFEARGAVQVIYRNAATEKGELGITATNGIYEITDTNSALSFTAVAGTYKVNSEYLAAAKNTETGEVTVSDNGILTLPSLGKYTVDLCEEYVVDGDKLTVYKEGIIDLSAIAHEEKDNQLFVGWVYETTGTAPEGNTTFKYGDVLVAKYIDCTADDFIMEEAQVRDKTSLRYVFTQNKAVTNQLPEIVEYGALTLSTDTANGGEFFVDKAYVKSWSWDTTLTGDAITEFEPNTYGEQAIKVKADNILEENEDCLKYTLCITGLDTVDKSATFYGARGYLIFKDYNGIQQVLYTEQRQSSLYKAAAEAPDNEKTEDHKYIIDAYEADRTTANLDTLYAKTYISGPNATGEDADTNANHILYKQNGLTIGEALISTNRTNTQKTEILFFTDSHFNYTNEVDMASGNRVLMANYRARTWLGNGASGPITSKILNYASYFKKMVSGGDAVDYFSDGSLNMTYRLLTEKSINNSLSMLIGNHETGIYGGNALDISFNLPTIEEKESMKAVLNSKYFTNNATYYSEVMDGIKLIYLDNAFTVENGSYQFTEPQVAKLQADLEAARANDYPVLLFTHVPLCTYNDEYASVYTYDKYMDQRYGTESNHTGTLNFKDLREFCGSSGATEATQSVCELIRKNSDIVKGVFNGHTHIWAYTEIVGLNEDGTPNENRIPQYNVAGTPNGCALRIIVD